MKTLQMHPTLFIIAKCDLKQQPCGCNIVSAFEIIQKFYCEKSFFFLAGLFLEDDNLK